MKKVTLLTITAALLFSVGVGAADAKGRSGSNHSSHYSHSSSYHSSSHSGSDVYVHGYSRHNGTYVPSHHRTYADTNFYNNWSTKGNVNPYTGKLGYKTHR